MFRLRIFSALRPAGVVILTSLIGLLLLAASSGTGQVSKNSGEKDKVQAKDGFKDLFPKDGVKDALKDLFKDVPKKDGFKDLLKEKFPPKFQPGTWAPGEFLRQAFQRGIDEIERANGAVIPVEPKKDGKKFDFKDDPLKDFKFKFDKDGPKKDKLDDIQFDPKAAGPSGLDDEGICLGGIFLPVGGKASFTRELRRHTQYTLLVTGDNDVQGLYAEIQDGNGRVIARDASASSTGKILFFPPRDGTYRLTIRLLRARAASMCTFFLLRQGCEPLGKAAHEQSLNNFLKSASAFDNSVPELVQYADGWSVLGTLLKNGKEQWLNGLRLGSGKRAIVAGADNSASDVDLFLFDSEDNLLAKDVALDPTPKLVFTTLPGALFNLNVVNVSEGQGRRPAFTVFAILRLLPGPAPGNFD